MEDLIRVAVAEDEDYLRRDIGRSITRCPGMELAGEAASGADIVRLVLEQPVDVVLMDIEMERYDSGIQAAARIAEEKPQVIVIFLTVHEEDELVYQAFTTAPNVDYIVKSAEHSQILRKIRDTYEGRNRIDPQIMRKITDEFGRMRRKQASMMYFFNVLFTITPSEKELIKMLLAEMTVTQIARERCVEVSTVKSQINTLLKKFHMSRTREVTSLIRALGIEQIFSDASSGGEKG